MNTVWKTTIIITQTITRISKQFYHLPSLLQSKHQEEHVRLHSDMFHLYLDKLEKSSFKERLLSVLAVDCYRTAQPAPIFQRLVDYSHQHLEAFKGRAALMAHYHHKDPESVLPLARQALTLPQQQGSAYGWYNLKLIIALQQTVGVDKLGEEWLRKIDYSKFRPITLAMVLQVLFGAGMGQSKLAEQLVDMFVACEQIIPLADVHHLSYAIRKVTNPRFRQCYFRVRNRIQSTISAKSIPAQTTMQFATDEQLIELMRQRLMAKYKQPISTTG